MVFKVSPDIRLSHPSPQRKIFVLSFAGFVILIKSLYMVQSQFSWMQSTIITPALLGCGKDSLNWTSDINWEQCRHILSKQILGNLDNTKANIFYFRKETLIFFLLKPWNKSGRKILRSSLFHRRMRIREIERVARDHLIISIPPASYWPTVTPPVHWQLPWRIRNI